jgi:hypothetical protein
MKYTREKFVQDLCNESVDRTVSSLKKSLMSPAGRKPAERLVLLSQWYKSLNPEQEKMCQMLMEDTAESTLFSTLVVLDGVSLISEELRDADIRLTIVKDGEELLLSSSKHDVDNTLDDLHDLMFSGPDDIVSKQD